MTYVLVIVSTKMPPDLVCKKAIFKQQNFFCVVYHITQLGSCIITMVCPISQRFHDHYVILNYFKSYLLVAGIK